MPQAAASPAQASSAATTNRHGKSFFNMTISSRCRSRPAAGMSGRAAEADVKVTAVVRVVPDQARAHAGGARVLEQAIETPDAGGRGRGVQARLQLVVDEDELHPAGVDQRRQQPPG